MLDPNHPIAKLARRDGRYHEDAYTFVFDALNHAHTVLGMGAKPCHREATAERDEIDRRGEGDEPERHVTGQELCGAIRHLAQEQYGLMAKCVLNQWGVRATADFGNIVFNLIEIGQMRKTDTDSRADFNNVFDFDRDLLEGFEIVPPE